MRSAGFEPATAPLGPALLVLSLRARVHPVGLEPTVRRSRSPPVIHSRAHHQSAERGGTRDFQLGKPAFCRLMYPRTDYRVGIGPT